VFRERHAQVEQYAPDDGGQQQMLEAGSPEMQEQFPARAAARLPRAKPHLPTAEEGVCRKCRSNF